MNSKLVELPLPALLKKAWFYYQQKDVEMAVQASNVLNQKYSTSGEAWFYTSQVALAVGNKQAANEALNHCCSLNPSNVDWQLKRVMLLLQLDKLVEAKHKLDAVSNSTLLAVEHSQVGMAYFQLNVTYQAEFHYQQAIKLQPSYATHHYNLATISRHQGKLELAKKHLTTAITLNPQDIGSQTLLIDLEKQTADNNRLQILTELEQAQLAPKNAVQIKFAIAKSLEDMQQYNDAFEHLQLGCQLRRKHLNYDINQDITTLDLISRKFDAQWWQGLPQLKTCEITPIFILGMPRTGSTLVDRILSNHPQVLSLGELNDFTRLLTQQVNSDFPEQIRSKADFITKAGEINFTQLGENYLNAIIQRAKLTAPDQTYRFVIDKLPFNYLYIGLIKKALPNAIIIHTQRNPMDTCYAIYKTLFEQAYPFSYDQTELAKYYCAYKKLMAHWQSLPELNTYSISYENLVNQPQSTAKQLFNHCQLDWHDSFIDVKQNQSVINTASSSQVRKDIHKTSVNKWQHYQTQLTPMLTLLQQAGVETKAG